MLFISKIMSAHHDKLLMSTIISARCRMQCHRQIHDFQSEGRVGGLCEKKREDGRKEDEADRKVGGTGRQGGRSEDRKERKEGSKDRK